MGAGGWGLGVERFEPKRLHNSLWRGSMYCLASWKVYLGAFNFNGDDSQWAINHTGRGDNDDDDRFRRNFRRVMDSINNK